MTVPFVDLRAQYLDIKGEVDAAIQRVIDRNAFIGGEEVRAFQDEFAAYCAEQAGRPTGDERPAAKLSSPRAISAQPSRHSGSYSSVRVSTRSTSGRTSS